jgi:hypothetical protein
VGVGVRILCFSPLPFVRLRCCDGGRNVSDCGVGSGYDFHAWNIPFRQCHQLCPWRCGHWTDSTNPNPCFSSW